jgi:hypothetical protein
VGNGDCPTLPDRRPQTVIEKGLELGGGELFRLPCGFVVELEECAKDDWVGADAVVDPPRLTGLARGLPLFVDASNVSITRQNRRGHNTTRNHRKETRLNSPSSAS